MPISFCGLTVLGMIGCRTKIKHNDGDADAYMLFIQKRIKIIRLE